MDKTPSSSEKFDVHLGVRITKTIHKALKAKAAKARMSPATYIRWIVLNDLDLDLHPVQSTYHKSKVAK